MHLPRVEMNEYYPQCPYCKVERVDVFELGSEGEIKCDNCGGKYSYEREVTAYFTTVGIAQNSEEMKP